MHLLVDVLGIESGGKPIVFLNNSDAGEIGVTASGRVSLRAKKEITAIVNISTRTVKKGHIGISEEVRQLLGRTPQKIDVEISAFPKSLQFIRNKLEGRKLLKDEVFEIVKGVVDGTLNESEIASFVTALHIRGLDLDEATSLSQSMVETGNQLNLQNKVIVDKHSIGGVPGDKTTLLVVPIVAAAGLVIPKTSSRAITSAAGTADRAESLMPVTLSAAEMKKTIKKTNGCIVWGGALDLAPADDIFVKTEYSLYIDPLLLPSIMSKKKAVGATHVVLDIPTGRGAKVKTINEADHLAKDLIELGRRLKMHTHCVLSYGEQPVGHSIGPALEAKEALEVIMNEINVPDLVDKACKISGAIFEITGHKNGYAMAQEILRSGRAEKKLRQIIAAQGGNPMVRPRDIPIGSETIRLKAKNDGKLLWINNSSIVEIARMAGAPKDRGAGIVFNKKIGDNISKDDVIFTVYAEKSRKLSRTEDLIEQLNPVGIGKRTDMIIHMVTEIPEIKRSFVLER
ncbi:MAG TPA: AMP phosphorylase [Candidatus Nitrosotenuis sp.]|nr:AMP phosphorylase [Candidatus Nitrosotenuis sp.]HIH46475.1 AMP phosphorylase [Candidatus Nitrosotenuis sp.]HIH67977.1 AMP phosphorylase [Candidatus Nitrosotenuis sp.]HII03756.1 AMP phosphorylase [Candidatus Nitrosotenuis sp.]